MPSERNEERKVFTSGRQAARKSMANLFPTSAKVIVFWGVFHLTKVMLLRGDDTETGGSTKI